VTEFEIALTELPKCWVWTEIGSFTEVLGGKRLPKGHDFSTTPTTYPYIRVTDFAKMTVNTQYLRFLKNETHELIKKYTRP
jgi:type I restriction enzyme S subunit